MFKKEIKLKRKSTGQRGRSTSIYLLHKYHDRIEWWMDLTGENLNELIMQALDEFFKSKGK